VLDVDVPQSLWNALNTLACWPRTSDEYSEDEMYVGSPSLHNVIRLTAQRGAARSLLIESVRSALVNDVDEMDFSEDFPAVRILSHACVFTKPNY
jgi:hypothetical protein